MTDQHKENSSDVLQTSAAAAQAVSGALKTGKAAAKIAKGAAAGGPYGAAASALWEGRKIVANIVIAVIAFLMIPVVVIMMLPSLIFGGCENTFSPADPNNPIINSGAALLEVTTQIAAAVQSVLADALSATEAEIQSNFEESKADRMEIVNASISKSSFYVSTENTGRVMAKLQRLPYQLQLDPDGNITGIQLSRSSIGNDYPIFQEIAPYIRDKSFILFSGDGQEAWKWIFENGKCRKVVPQIIWGE